MGDLLIRDISDAMKTDLAALAKATDTSLSEAAKLAIAQGVAAALEKSGESPESQAMGDRLHGLFAGVFASDEEAQTFHDEIERMRKADFGRPLPDFE
jgi:hypothetical protein